MLLDIFKSFFMWCTIINAVFLTVMAIIFTLLRERITYFHSRLYGLPSQRVGSILYQLIGIYKILIILLFLIPWIVLVIIT